MRNPANVYMQKGPRQPEAETHELTKGILKRLLRYISVYKYHFILAILLTLLSNQLALLGPLYSGRAIDALSLRVEIPRPNVAPPLSIFKTEFPDNSIT